MVSVKSDVRSYPDLTRISPIVNRRVRERQPTAVNGRTVRSLDQEENAAENLLLRLPAAADNAAMEAEPIAATPKRKRRWFQFSLRALLIGVTLLAAVCGYVGWQAKIVYRRQSRMATLLKSHPAWFAEKCEDCHLDYDRSDDEVKISLIRRWLGDRPYRAFCLSSKTSPEEEEQIRDLFPEATIYIQNRTPVPKGPKPPATQP